MVRTGGSQPSNAGSNPVSVTMAPSSKRHRMSPFQGGDASSILVGAAVVMADIEMRQGVILDYVGADPTGHL